ncbi:MAG: alpha/beta hydrolase [Cyanobacteria bacterium SZAS LIN-2]|nr:alpha/beta hydrolase [Cyanobacteria bacterium SZAS LIN-3]MBS1995421.1 alpha/beta hydrolase [Cyanobacteria bacterium SZAS LIN-2]
MSTSFPSIFKLRGVLALGVLVSFLLTVSPARSSLKNEPLLFVSERSGVHLNLKASHARENLFKVVQGEKYFYGSHVKGREELTDESAFYTGIDEARKQTPAAPLVIFVHGCCVSFHEQLYQGYELKKAIDDGFVHSQAAQSGAAVTGRPVVLTYDWAAPFSYATSLVNAGGAQSRFDSFMQGMVNRYGSENIIIVAHSLGTVMVQNYLERISDSSFKPYKTIVFSRADLDRQSFSDCLPELKARSQRLMLLASDNDPNIYFSSLLRRWGVRFAQVAILPTWATMPLTKKKEVQFSEPDKPVSTNIDSEKSDEEKAEDGALLQSTVTAEERHKGLTRRLGQIKVAREFGSTVEVYDMSSFRIGHGIPYMFIGGVIFNDFHKFELKKEPDGVVIVRRAIP